MTSTPSLPLPLLIQTKKQPPPPPPPSQNPPKKPLKQDPALSLLQLSHHLKEATQIHALLIKTSRSSDPYFAGRLSEFYALSPRGANLPFAERILHSLPQPHPLFIYNTLMRAHLNLQDPDKTLQLFEQILTLSLPPDHFTFTFALKACTGLTHDGALIVGTQLHCFVIKLGLESSPHIRNKLIHLYAICGRVEDARKVFDGSSEWDVVAWNSMLRAYAGGEDGGDGLWELFRRMPDRDVVSWNTVIGFYIEIGEFDEAMMVFRSMLETKECFPNRVTMITVLSAVCQSGALGQGKWIHAYVNRRGIELDENLSSALINMY